ncbi:MAG: FRG domain-containing protein [Paenibacillaceae bacterium]|nr:FRG domain-containing protein [Paenibacillaceae bacterium]
MKTIKINSLEDLENKISEYNKDFNCWFRGQSNSDYLLQPGAYRELYVIKDHYNLPVRPTMLGPGDYNSRGDSIFIPAEIYLDLFIKILKQRSMEFDDKLSRLTLACIGQHYGLKTRLLDWSSDATVALFFATEDIKKDSEAAFFILRPDLYNEKVTGESKIFDVDDICKLDCDYAPVAFNGPKNTKRICRQSGNFTIHGRNVWPFDKYECFDEVIYKFTLSYELSLEIQKKLRSLGINKDSIYVNNDFREEVAKEVIDLSKKEIKNFLTEKEIEWKSLPNSERGYNRYLQQ